MLLPPSWDSCRLFLIRAVEHEVEEPSDMAGAAREIFQLHWGKAHQPRGHLALAQKFHGLVSTSAYHQRGAA